MSEWSRRRTLHAVSLGSIAALSGCHALTGTRRPARYAVELRNYADRATAFQIRVEGDSDESIWEFTDELDAGRAVNEIFRAIPSVIDVAVDDETVGREWKRSDCGERQHASTAHIQYGANTEMDQVGVQFRCEDLAAKYSE